MGEEGETGGASLSALASGLNIDRPVMLVGMMGAGKSVIGRRLAVALRLPFRDADAEIETAAQMTVAEIFEQHGEPEFRRGERQVIARLLQEGPLVLATGGGAYMDEGTRALAKAHAITIWLKADLDVLMRRVEKREGRPLLRAADPRGVMTRLLREREPFYALADLAVESGPGPHQHVVEAVLRALRAHLAAPAEPAP